jgi:hypothetical protein
VNVSSRVGRIHILKRRQPWRGASSVPQPRLGTRYEKSLKRRFEKADQVFSEIYLRKARLDKKGLRTYTVVELRQDLYAAAFGHGLCAEALMAYFQVLHRREILRIFSEVQRV